MWSTYAGYKYFKIYQIHSNKVLQVFDKLLLGLDLELKSLGQKPRKLP